MKKAELLAPAGSKDGFLAALNAGADAFYLGGNRFSARAYADNFSEEDLLEAIKMAHFFGKKVYMTLNTLIKPSEIVEILDYMEPFYLGGLDGVIVQDLGVLRMLHENFPGMELHASTQMTITGYAGANLLKKFGVTRVVPARELTLPELVRMKEETGLELECFIHGAMCYCYSGQCLYSSALGGRSGNRGRCAQPCRLPYEILDENGIPFSGQSFGSKSDHSPSFQGKTQVPNGNKKRNTRKAEGSRITGFRQDSARGDGCFPLSMKDMCSLPLLPLLLEAGIDSLKIEGRMKKPEYSGGVTAIYRKYLDRFYEYGKDNWIIDADDQRLLQSLYVRTKIQSGYYQKRNGKEMITLSSPAYSETPDELVADLHQKYVTVPKGMQVTMDLSLQESEPALLTINGILPGGDAIVVSKEGPAPFPAQNAPVTEEALKKQLQKTGGTPVFAKDIHISAGDNLFYPNGSINELRRNTINSFVSEVIDHQFPSAKLRARAKRNECKPMIFHEAKISRPFDVSVLTIEQLKAVLDLPIRRIYLDADLVVNCREECLKLFSGRDVSVFLSLPYMFRDYDREYGEDIKKLIASDFPVSGLLVRNLEEVGFFQDCGTMLIADAGLYVWNKEADLSWKLFTSEITLPHELNRQELINLSVQGSRGTMIVYGKTPLMITANCVRKSMGACKGQGPLSHYAKLKDRYDITFRVSCNCMHCYNVIWNSVPKNLYAQVRMGLPEAAMAYRLDFTDETADVVKSVCLEFLDDHTGTNGTNKSNGGSTIGWYKKGVE